MTDDRAPDGDAESAGAPGTDVPEPSRRRERPVGRQSGYLDRLAARLEVGPLALRAILAVTLVGLVARLAWLGRRGAHFDEGRVAYWTLRYARTGHFEYRSIIHGPLVQHVDRLLFALVGPSDFVMRLPVALVGASLPLVALWYRDHLDDAELVGMAGLLALNPLLLYYSRFLRSDLLVATFMLAALGALVRLRATGRPRYLYAAAALGALGFASKENAVVYVLCWLGAGALLLEVRLFRPRGHATGLALVRARIGEFRTWVAGDGDALVSAPAKRAGRHLLGATALLLATSLLLFAPRAGAVGGTGLWRALADPTQLPQLLRTTAMDVAYGYGRWFGGAAEPGCRKETLVGGYGCYLWRMATTTGQFATATALLAAVGFLRERYAVADGRPLVMAAGFWGVASFFGYPLGTDIWAAWVVTHVVVPLTIPAGVGFGAVVGLARRGLVADRERQVTVPVVVLLVLGLWTGGIAAQASFVEESTRQHTADVVQYAQPDGGIKPAVAAMGAAVEGHDGGPDVVYYGERFAMGDESVADQPPIPPDGGAWFDRLPLPWYTASMNATTASTASERGLGELLGDRPPVVVTDHGAARDVRRVAEGYRTYTFDLRAHVGGPRNSTRVVVFVDERRLDGGE